MEKTIEYPNNVSKIGHIRTYGRDYVKKLEKSGFLVSCEDFIKELDNRLINK